MTIAECKIRIKKALDRLNKLDNKVFFSVKETEYGVDIICESKTKTDTRFGAYECYTLFSDYKENISAYYECMFFVETLVLGQMLNDPNSYHNKAF